MTNISILIFSLISVSFMSSSPDMVNAWTDSEFLAKKNSIDTLGIHVVQPIATQGYDFTQDFVGSDFNGDSEFLNACLRDMNLDPLYNIYDYKEIELMIHDENSKLKVLKEKVKVSLGDQSRELNSYSISPLSHPSLLIQEFNVDTLQIISGKSYYDEAYGPNYQPKVTKRDVMRFRIYFSIQSPNGKVNSFGEVTMTSGDVNPSEDVDPEGDKSYLGALHWKKMCEDIPAKIVETIKSGSLNQIK